jgi:hypothetical protein
MKSSSSLNLITGEKMLKTMIHDGAPRLAALVLLFSGCLGAATATVFSNFGPGDRTLPV